MDHEQQSEQPHHQQLQIIATSDFNKRPIYGSFKIYEYNEGSSDEEGDDGFRNGSLIDHIWSKKILELVGNKAKLIETFSWLSTVGGGFSALGESDADFSYKAGALSIGQQLHLAELLGDDRLKIMCHLFFALASLQLKNHEFCINYCRKVVVPLINKLPFRDSVLDNILRHILFRIRIAGLKRIEGKIDRINIE